MRVEKTKALISFAVTAKLTCVFVFAYVKNWFSHNEAHIISFFVVLLHDQLDVIKFVPEAGMNKIQVIACCAETLVP